MRTAPVSTAIGVQLDAFRERVQSHDARQAKLLAREAAKEEPGALLDQAFRELRIQREELLLAEEELRVQIEEIGRARVDLQEEREVFAAVFEHAADAQLVTDFYGVIRRANGAAIELLQVPSRFIIGKPLAAYAVDARALVELVTRSANGASARAFLELRARDGSMAEVDASVRADRENAGLLWTLRGHGDEAPASRATRAAGAESERANEEHLARERAAREELERASATKDRFIAMLSHDLRAPLNAILGWAQLLRGDVLDEPMRARAFETIERNALAQGKLIEDLLDVSCIGANQVPLSLVPVDLRLLIQQVVHGATPRAHEKEIVLRCDLAPTLVVRGDARRLEQVFTNLLTNALKFSVAGGRIDLEGMDDGEEVLVVVRDTGRGIDASLLPHVFDLYTQNGADPAARSGLGLGLYIVRQLVGLHGGSVTAASGGRGRGAAFTLRFPRLADPAPTESSSGSRVVHL